MGYVVGYAGFGEGRRQIRRVAMQSDHQCVGAVARRQRTLPLAQRVRLAAQHHDARRRERFFQRGEQTHKGAGLALHRAVKQTDRARRRLDITRLADHMPQPLQRERGNAVARRRGVVVARFAAMDEFFVIVAGEEKAAVLCIFKLIEQPLRQRAREHQIISAKLGLHQLQQRIEQKRVVVEVRIQMRLAVFAGGEQAAIFPQRAADKIQRALCGGEPRWLVEHARRARHALDHQRVPTGQDFFIAARPDALVACREQFGACASEQRFASVGQRLGNTQVPVRLFEIRRVIQTVMRCCYRVFFRRQQRFDLIRGPYVKLAFDVF